MPVEDYSLVVFSKQNDAKQDNFRMVEKRALRCGYEDIVEDFKNADGNDIRIKLCTCAGKTCRRKWSRWCFKCVSD